MKSKTKCLNCDKEITSKDGKIFCSKSCSASYNNLQRQKKEKPKCLNCGIELKLHNQKYCSNQCCRVATNKRIMQKYYEKRRRLSGEERLCDCGAPLSKYTSGNICAMCEIKETKAKTETAKESIENIIAGLAKSKSKKSSRN